MAIQLVATHLGTDNNIRGFRLLDTDTFQKKDVPYASVLANISKGAISIVGLKVERGELAGSNGVLSRYPTIRNSNLVGVSALVVLKEVEDLGYLVSDWLGRTREMTAEQVIAYAEKNGIANGKITSINNTKIVSSIYGNYEIVKKPKAVKNNSEQPVTSNRLQGATLVKKQEISFDDKLEKNMLAKLSNGIPRVFRTEPQFDPNNLFDKTTGFSVLKKLARAFMVLKEISPFSWCLLKSLDIVASGPPVATAAVSLHRLYYNPLFFNEVTCSELVFILCHEAAHLLMMHHLRRGTRDPKVWNIAGDLYINSAIKSDFDISDATIFDEHAEIDRKYCEGIKILKGSLYSDKVDIHTDTVEKIYEELMSEKQKEQKEQKEQQEQQGQQGGDPDEQQDQGNEQGDQGNEQGEQGDQGDQGEQGNDQGDQGNEQGEQGNEQGEQGNEQDGEGGDQGEESGQTGSPSGAQGKVKKDSGVYKFRGDDLSVGASYEKDNSNGDGETDNSKCQGAGGLSKVNTSIQSDLVEDEKSSKMSKEQQEQRVKGMITRAEQHCKQIGASVAGFIGLEAIKNNAPVVNWRSLLRDKLTKSSQRSNSYARPDRRFIGRKQILPGAKNTDPDSLENVKVCIDTSASISSEELGMALLQIEQLFKLFGAEAELLYWDTDIRKSGRFKTAAEAMKIKPEGGGGTDATCLFEYFDRTPGIKPNIIIIFTDGYISPISNKYSKYKDTIWVINQSDYKEWKKPFGRVAPFKTEI